ncbi:hypothetical protein BDV36DRAFT_271593 [Aspergillus pseudocaelatus]|uniref:Fungal-type protein kinase domain-containing protein n=1 Tax=Aspergillus pseudocaelatus TaxID=1825620 RepID=A0ABQ6W5K4_9EURO|nr:hypothetical protein BDV36DRAFT_271593 [Aspergillus pseudocaelatus]
MITIWKHTNSLGIPHRPFGHDWTEMRNHVSRLLILRGMIQTGSDVPEGSVELHFERVWSD